MTEQQGHPEGENPEAQFEHKLMLLTSWLESGTPSRIRRFVEEHPGLLLLVVPRPA